MNAIRLVPLLLLYDIQFIVVIYIICATTYECSLLHTGRLIPCDGLDKWSIIWKYYEETLTFNINFLLLPHEAFIYMIRCNYHFLKIIGVDNQHLFRVNSSFTKHLIELQRIWEILINL